MKIIHTNMKNINKILLISTFIFFLAGDIALADTDIHLTIKTNSGNIYDQNMSISPCNNDNGATTDLKITGYCAVMQTGFPSNWNWAWPPGAFLDSLNDVAGYTSQDSSGTNVYHYWSWAVNGTDGMTGLNEYELLPNNLITLTFVDPTDPSTIPITMSGSAPVSVKENKIKLIFNTKKALDFLSLKQKDNGSFGEDLHTDWITLAFAANENYETEKSKLKKYYSTSKISDGSLTDYERRSMALMSLGLDPYNTNGENYIGKITKDFDGKQFGNPFEDNDDIFALVVLQNAGFTKDESIIKNTIDFITSKQKGDGSWDESVDLTGAAMESLAIYKDDNQIKNVLEGAKKYLLKKQRDDHSFNGNISSTAWAQEGLLAINEEVSFEYFADNQTPDGGIKEADTNSKIWETAYATSTASGKTWNEIMQKFEKPKIEEIASPKIEAIQKINTKTKNIIKKIIPINETPIAPTKEEKKGWFKIFLNIFGI